MLAAFLRFVLFLIVLAEEQVPRFLLLALSGARVAR